MHRSHLRALCDHLDVRVRDLAEARAFYDRFFPALGLTEIHIDFEGWVVYRTGDRTDVFVGVTEDPTSRGSLTRIALRADSPSDVDRIAAVAEASGAKDFEPAQLCPEYGEGYYASFFSDPSGNRLEICYRVTFVE